MNNFFRVAGGIFIACLLSFFAGAQSTVVAGAKRMIDTLTSHTMDGRGYVDSGEWKAANYIEAVFKSAGLSPFNGNYFQRFYLDANTFPGRVSVAIDRHQLIPGKDFLIDPSSPGVKGKFRIVRIKNNSKDTSLNSVDQLLQSIPKEKISNEVIAFSRKEFLLDQYKYLEKKLLESNGFGCKGIIEFSDEKLTWDASQTVQPFFYLTVKVSPPSKKKSCVKVDIENKFKQHYPTQNIIAWVKGSAVPDSFLVFTAHYDHLGQMGNGTYFPGANDNASGTAMVLSLAEYFSDHPAKYSIAFMLFSGEESGLLGSHFYVDHPLFPLSNIKFLTNLDIVGTGDEGIKVVNATEFKSEFDTLVRLNQEHQYLKEVSPRGKTANSDHYFFYEEGVPCFFIYTMGGITAYHDIYDRAETLPLTKFDNLYHLLIDFVSTFQID